MLKAFRVYALLACCLAASTGCGDAGGGCRAAGIWSGESSAPDFELPLYQTPSQTLHLAEFNRDLPVLLIFWATWCPSCVNEIPILNRWHSEYAGQMRILSVNVEETAEAIAEFASKVPIEYPVVLDADGRTASQYGIRGLPVAVFLAKGGEILYYGFGLPADIAHFIKKGSDTGPTKGV